MSKYAAAVCLVLCLFLGCSSKEAPQLTSVSQLNDSRYTIGYGEGHSAYTSIKESLPKAKLRSFNSHITGFEAVRQGKIDGYAFERRLLELAINEGLPGVHILDGNIGKPIDLAVGISPVSRIPELENKINAFIEEIRSDGTYEEMVNRWLSGRTDVEMPEIKKAENPVYHLAVGTTGEIPMFTFYKGTELAGFDIEFAERFAQWLNADLEFKVYNYDGIVAAACSGNIDCIMANLNVTPERLESIRFSVPVFTVDNTVLVRDTGSASPSAPMYQSVEELNTSEKTIGIQIGVSYIDKYTREILPEAETKFCNSIPEMVQMLTSGKLDGFIMDEPIMRYVQRESKSFALLPLELPPVDYCFAFSKSSRNTKIYSQFNDFLEKNTADGTVAGIFDAWFGTDEERKTVDISGLNAKNGVITVALEALNPPFEYIKDGKIVGTSVEILKRFCTEYGYSLELHDMAYDALFPAIQTNRYDITPDLPMTEEAKDVMLFSQPVYRANMALAVPLMKNSRGSTFKSFLNEFGTSFEKTFVRESRWKLVVDGIGVTALISILSALFGTVLGFGICAMRMCRNRLANAFSLVYIRIMQGMPMVVLLMIMFYIVFARASISGVWVAVIGFGMNFGAYVSEMIRTGILAVDKGQMEAALALGYTKPRAFMKIVLPQAARHFLPVFQGEFISLVKMTSVVGYIAIQDLTKAGDIIRSRTYEAFFPLIAIAIVYFVIAWLLTRVLVALQNRFDPKKRRK